VRTAGSTFQVRSSVSSPAHAYATTAALYSTSAHTHIYMYLALHSVQSAVANTVRTAGYTFQHFFADLHECFAQLKVRVLS